MSLLVPLKTPHHEGGGEGEGGGTGLGGISGKHRSA